MSLYLKENFLAQIKAISWESHANAMLSSLAASSAKSVQCTALAALLVPNAALRLVSWKAVARAGSGGPQSFLNASTGHSPCNELTSRATDGPASLPCQFYVVQF